MALKIRQESLYVLQLIFLQLDGTIIRQKKNHVSHVAAVYSIWVEFFLIVNNKSLQWSRSPPSLMLHNRTPTCSAIARPEPRNSIQTYVINGNHV